MSTGTQYKFTSGQLVHHKRYNYRGVVVMADATCQAPEDWYQRNRTQPDRNQPWYHVLVHGGGETYVAETNLEPDTSTEVVAHPLVHKFFSVLLNGRYHRFSPN